ncbi:ABC transporter ATP-binding protein [Peredibacter starrii]|uniref:ABC transporter ATP-binding protein n=1 Tax=Peredibacter starrii TaxID=28202 RepID=A0AAX4HPF7_9BACT|nr:ABC transporter ATP-binding protein [Peredibacter starrii]WPU64992.1 ABC transporter ATP-binding protein [Peredibacter starrii]
MQFELINVEKVYQASEENKVYGARNVNLSIPEGEFMALVGPSGSGKTTILNLIAGLILPTGGVLKHGGNDITSMSLEERTQHRLDYMGFIFQDYQLLPILTAAENIEFPLQLKGFSKAEISDRVNWALKQVGLEKMGNRFPKQLSGGQQQRVSIARAIAGKPQLILADEPTANLDSKTAQEIIDLFKKLNQDFKLTFVFSTHDQRLIDQIRTVQYIKDGQITETRKNNV